MFCSVMSKDMVEREGGGRGTIGLPFPHCMVTGSKQRLHRFQKLLLLSITIDSRNESKPLARAL